MKNTTKTIQSVHKYFLGLIVDRFSLLMCHLLRMETLTFLPALQEHQLVS